MSVEWADPQLLDKVSRLLEMLEEIDLAPDLSGKLVLHGGTALNLFLLEAPRLSIDIDLNYIGGLNVDDVERERPAIEERLSIIARSLGYRVTRGREEHAGQNLKLRYKATDGTHDWIKIDLSYLARVPLLPPERRMCRLEAGARPSFPILHLEEIYGGKIRAMLERIAPRDLYDVYMMAEMGVSDSDLCKAIVVFQISLSAPFPFEVGADRLDRFTDELIRRELLPTLRAGVAVEGAVMRGTVKNLIKLPDDAPASHTKYLQEFAKGNYKPEPIFSDWPEVLERAQVNPAIEWKLMNLRKVL